jgi:hypothetical protein
MTQSAPLASESHPTTIQSVAFDALEDATVVAPLCNGNVVSCDDDDDETLGSGTLRRVRRVDARTRDVTARAACAADVTRASMVYRTRCGVTSRA